MLSSSLQPLMRLGRCMENEPLAKYTSFRIGGPADLLIEPESIASVPQIIQIAKGNGIPWTVIGGGSNLLVGDRGVRGIVLRLCSGSSADRVRIEEDTFIYSEASIKKEDFIAFCLEQGFGGMEFLAGIPGCVGGGIIMNAGTSDGCFADILKRIALLDADGNVKIRELPVGGSHYRSMNLPADCVVLSGFFSLPQERNVPALRKKIESIITDRWQKHPMEFASAGSVFKNPAGHSSWKLINDAGLRGESIGDAQVSIKHTNFIVNRGGATALDIRNLIDHVRETVLSRFGITLEPEVKILGEF